MKYIPLSATKKATTNKDKYFVMVDDEDYEWLIKWNWSVHVLERTCYPVRTTTSKGKTTLLYMHNAVMNRTAQELKDDVRIDHRDHNGLNCQKSNLRRCTHQQNCKNMRSRKNSSSKYLGVGRIKDSRKGKRNKIWHAQISVGGKGISLGVYETEQEAAFMYDLAALKYHGEFGCFNILFKGFPT